MNNKLFFIVNGQYYCSNNNLTIYQLLTYLNYDLSLIVLEYNGIILTKEKWNNFNIKPQDQLEIITIVGGG